MSSSIGLKPKEKQSVIKSAMAMAVGTFSSRILGFLRDAIMLAIFPRSVTDCWIVAFRLPNLFRRLLGEGTLSPSFIPIYVEAKHVSRERALDLSNAVFTIIFSVSTIISVACFVWMDWIVWHWVGDPRGFAADPAKVEQTIYLSRIMVFYLVLVSTYAFHTAIANTHGKFFIPAVGPTLFNFGLILFTVTHFELGAWPGSTQSWGVIFGGLLQMGIVMWILWVDGWLPRFSLRWRVPGVARVFGNMLPGLFGLGVFQVMTIVNTMFAARLSEGAQTYIYSADRILELPQSLIAVSLGAALLPRFSELHTAGERTKFLEEANHAVRMLFYLSLPSAVGMFVLALPITQVLFMHGEFGMDGARATAEIIEIYSVLMLFSSLARVTTPAFYAIKNTWLPAAVALFVLCVHISLGPWLVARYQLPGLASATSASSVLNIVLLQIFFYFWIGPLGYGRILRSVALLVPALVILGLFCHFAWPFLLEWSSVVLSAGKAARTLSLFVVILLGMVLYFFTSVLCGSAEAAQVLGRVLRRRR